MKNSVLAAIIVGCTVVICMVLIATCQPQPTSNTGTESIGQPPDNPFVGTWVNPSGFGSSTFTLRADGTGCTYGFVLKEEDITWHAEGNMVMIDGYSREDYFHIPKLTPDGKALIYGGETYFKQNE